ncbi:MAG: hypothetical protein GF331_02700, partial [Chitinivibrionales bacterium]|nr:hypothetical protein [Chitinivibrionales bacterium]
AEDVFPHTRVGGRTVDSLGPYTRPSTRSNDGGHTYLTMHIRSVSDAPPTEKYAIRDYFVRNVADTAFTISLDWSYLAPGWPHRIAPDSIFEALPADISPLTAGDELLVLSRTGELYVLPPEIDSADMYNRQAATIPVIDLNGDTLVDSTGARVLDTALYAARLERPVGMPSLIDGEVFVPLAGGAVVVLTGVDGGGGLLWDTVSLGATPSTHVCGFDADSWAVGCADGLVVFGSGRAVTNTLRLQDSSIVTAIAALPGSIGDIAVVQHNGKVSICAADAADAPNVRRVRNGIGPYTLVAGDLDRNDSGHCEIVVCDSRQGLWVLNDDLTIATGWEPQPNDWANAYALSEEEGSDDRRLLPYNPSPPSLGDINGDGHLDILVGGTNGVYALNYKGVLIKGWPYYLDNRYWLQRGSVTAAPVIGAGDGDKPLVLFTSPTGDNPTFGIVKITGVNENHTKVYYRRDDGAVDSIWDLEASLVDSILRYNDSLIAPYILPGGYVDAITPDAKRPYRGLATLPNVGQEAIYDWPLTVGATIGTSPLLCDLDGDNATDLIAVSKAGWVYRWEPDESVLSLSGNEWRMAGYGPSRAFAYMGAALSNSGGADTIGFYSFPNPTNGADQVVFRYAFSGKATDVRIDVFTYTGHLVYSWREPDSRSQVNYPDWNEHVMSLRKLGPAVYRCRLGAKINGKEHSRFWKLAVVK